MPPSLRPVGVLAAALVLGALAAATAGVHLAASVPWPIGLVTGCVLWQQRRTGTLAVLGITLAGMTAGLVVAGWGGEAIGVSLAHVAGVGTAVLVLTSAGRRRAALLSESDIGRYVSACVVGAGAAAVVVGVCCAVVESRLGLDEMTAMLVTHAASQLVLVPFFLRRHGHAALGSGAEQVASWVVTVVVTVLVFIVVEPSAVSFAVVVALAWGARRLGDWGALLQMTVVAAIATFLTLQGLGPFDPAPPRLDWTPDGPAMLVQLFVLCCALVVVPTMLTVGLEQVSLREASRERARIERIVTSADRVAIIGADAHGRMTLFNPGAERLLGYRAQEVLGCSGEMFHDPAEITRQAALLGVEDAYESIARAMARPEVGGHEIRYLRKDGVERTFLVNLSQVRDLEGGLTGYVCISEDITDRVREQQALEEAVTRLQELDVTKDTFVSSVSHELRTPLTSIVGYLELLRDQEYGGLSGPQSMALERISDNADRLLALIEELLTFSRLGEDLRVDRAEVDLVDVVRGACRLVEPLWQVRGTRVDVVLPSGEVPVMGDRALLERLVVNLVGNAVKFTAEQGRVDVVLRSGEGWAELVVADDGIGIPADEQPQIFTRFFRSRVAMRGAVQGTGVGLSIVKAVVEAHAGTVAIESTEGVGTTVRVRLPAM